MGDLFLSLIVTNDGPTSERTIKLYEVALPGKVVEKIF